MPTIFRTTNKKTGEPHRNWRFKYMNYLGQRKSATGLPTRKATETLAWKIQAEQDEIRNGLRPAPKESDKPHLFETIVAEYLAWGESQGGRGGRAWSKVHLCRRQAHLKFWQRRLVLERFSD